MKARIMPTHALLDSAPPHPTPRLIYILLLHPEHPIPESATRATATRGIAVVAGSSRQIIVTMSRSFGGLAPREWRVGAEVRRGRDGHGRAQRGPLGIERRVRDSAVAQ